MSPITPAPERRSAVLIQLSDFRPARQFANHAADAGVYAAAARHWDVIARGEARAPTNGQSTKRAQYMDDLGPWTVEEPTPLARQIALVEMGVTTEALLFGAIVLPLPKPRSPLRATVRRIAARLAR